MIAEPKPVTVLTNIAKNTTDIAKMIMELGESSVRINSLINVKYKRLTHKSVYK